MVEVSGCAKDWNRVGEAPAAAWQEAQDALVAAASVLPAPEEGLSWSDEPCVLVGDFTGSARRVRPALRVGELTLVLLDDSDQLLRTLPLANSEVRDVIEWLKQAGVSSDRDDGNAIGSPTRESLLDLERWLSNAAAVLELVAHRTRGASQVRTDPTTLETWLDIRLPSREDEQTRHIRLAFALSSTDGEPHVTISSGPDGSSKTMQLSEITAHRDGDAQAKAVEQFVVAALTEAYASLHREWRPRSR